MTPSEFHNATGRTWNRSPKIKHQMCNAALGLAGEWHEYIKSSTPDELGDLAHYNERLRSTVGLHAANYDEDVHWAALDAIHRCCEIVKTQTFHRKTPDWAKLKHQLRPLTNAIAAFVRRECDRMGVDMSRVFEANIAKLNERHADGFEFDADGYDAATGQKPEVGDHGNDVRGVSSDVGGE